MDASVIIFYVLAAMTLVSGVLAVTASRIFRAAIYLLFSLVGIAGIYFWLNYEFIAAVQIVVYVGGITVLIIFSIFLTQQAGEKLPSKKTSTILLTALACTFGAAAIGMQLLKHAFIREQASPHSPQMKEIGSRMLHVGNGGYALPFETLSLLLLAAMIGCIVIALRPSEEAGI
jgi:NADH-quinone oxidoreductase subunit J